jgi:hypothetical protein
MLKAVQNCVEKVGVNLAEAINMASLYPAELASKKRKGKYYKDLMQISSFSTKISETLQLYCRGII